MGVSAGNVCQPSHVHCTLQFISDIAPGGCCMFYAARFLRIQILLQSCMTLGRALGTILPQFPPLQCKAILMDPFPPLRSF